MRCQSSSAETQRGNVEDWKCRDRPQDLGTPTYSSEKSGLHWRLVAKKKKSYTTLKEGQAQKHKYRRLEKWQRVLWADRFKFDIFGCKAVCREPGSGALRRFYRIQWCFLEGLKLHFCIWSRGCGQHYWAPQCWKVQADTYPLCKAIGRLQSYIHCAVGQWSQTYS